jgi:predicted GNAT superfamily acetyltransferase
MVEVDVHIRRARGLDDYLACVALQKEVWGYSELEDIAAQPMLLIGDRFGGSVLVAEDAAGRYVGFAFAMPAWKVDKRLFWWSHMTAVVAAYRNRNVGLALKLRQRREALNHGIDLIEWTFDPLQALNGHFNVGKLGVVVREYEENVYGSTSSPLHRGLPTDRFVAEWHLDSDRVKQRTDNGDRSVILRDLDVLQRISEAGESPALTLEDGPLLLEVPTDLKELRDRDLKAASSWQQNLRQACRHYFSHGWSVTDFVRISEPGPQAFYVLEKTGS